MNKRFMIRMCTIFFFVGTFCPTLSIAATQAGSQKVIATGPITYQEIGDSLISSYGIIEAPVKPADVDPKAKKKLDLTPPVLSHVEQLKVTFDLLARHEQNMVKTLQLNLQDSPLITDAMRVTLKELDAFYGEGKNSKDTLMNEIDNTTTVFGKTQLAYLLAHPSSKEDVQHRQAFIKELVENPDLLEEVQKSLNEIKKAQSGFLSYFKENDPVSEQLFKDLYYSKPGFKNLNTNSIGLETLTRMGNLGTAWKIAGDGIIFFTLNYVGAKIAVRNGQRNPDGSAIDARLIAALKNTWNGFRSFVDPTQYYKQVQEVNLLANAWADAQRVNGYQPTAADLSLFKKGFLIALGVKGALTTAFVAYKGYIIKGAIAEAKQAKDATNYLQTKLIDVASMVNAAKKLEKVANTNSIMRDGIASIGNVATLFNSDSAPFKELIELLQANTFKGSASFFSLSGRVLAANRLMVDNKDQFAATLQAIGEIDACVSMAKLYSKMKHERVGYCFVDFANTAKPTLEINDFWNPFVDSKIVVTNSLHLGDGADAAKIILTGSNTGGKSTILKAIMISLVTGRSFGIAPASSMTMSDFAFIGSYLHINDDTANGESKFKAEVLRAKMLCDTLDNLPKDKFGFVVIDELFTGTSSANAANAAKKVATKLANLDNNLFILATHFGQLTALESENPGLIKNYKIEVYKDEFGNLVRTYKLEPGISTQNVANEILNEEIKDLNFGF